MPIIYWIDREKYWIGLSAADLSCLARGSKLRAMCGRMTLTRKDLREIADELDAEVNPQYLAEYRPRYNLAPTQRHWVLVADGARREIMPASFGLSGDGRLLVNVRAETLAKGGFRNRRQVLALADGFFEWKAGQVRQPVWFHRKKGELLLLAAIAAKHSFAVVTVDANEDVASVHGRMPAIVPASQAAAWLNGPPSLTLLKPLPAGELEATPVSSRVNRAGVDDPDCLAPPEQRGQLELIP